MANRQRACLKCLTEWKKAYRLIKYYPSRVQSVSQLVAFGEEMKADVNGVIQPMPKLATVIASKTWNKPKGERALDKKMELAGSLLGVDSLPASIPAPVPSEPDHDTVTVQHPAVVDFHGVVEGHNLAKVSTFPDETEVLIYGVCPNPRLLAAELKDGRKVSVWRGPRNWQLPARVICRKDPNTPPAAPIYTPV